MARGQSKRVVWKVMAPPADGSPRLKCGVEGCKVEAVWLRDEGWWEGWGWDPEQGVVMVEWKEVWVPRCEGHRGKGEK